MIHGIFLLGLLFYFQQGVRYEIRATLNDTTHTLTGTERIVYINRSPDTLREFYLHLYENAFRHKNTPRAKEFFGRYFFSLMKLLPIPEDYRGWIDIQRFEINGEPAPFEVDDDILRVDLPEPLAPGDSMIVELDFVEKYHKHMGGRAGWKGKHYDFGQWYPAVAVYDENGWHPYHYHLEGEFYHEFADFRVTLTVPWEYVVVASGWPVEGDPGWDLNKPKEEEADTLAAAANGTEEGHPPTRTVTFEAKQAVDFGWSCDPTFIVEDTTYKHVRIIAAYTKKSARMARDSFLIYALRSIEWLDSILGPFGYSSIANVEGLMRGGMEYPMYVIVGNVRSEGTVVHEIGHNYFYGLLANDQMAEAWMDEGGTTFQTSWYFATRYGPYGKGSPPKGLWASLIYRPTYWERQVNGALWFVRDGWDEPLSQYAHRFRNFYWQVYSKGSMFYRMHQYLMGEERFLKFLHTYYDRWKFKHVNEARMKAVAEEVYGQDLDWFYDQWLHQTKVVDFALEGWEIERTPNGQYRTTVRVRRLGDGWMPPDIYLVTTGGDTLIQRIQEPFEGVKTVAFTSEMRPLYAAVNPENEILDPWMQDNFYPPRFHVRPLIPFAQDRYPMWGYAVRFFPLVWYNRVDGWRAGAGFRGSYLGNYDRTSGLILSGKRLNFRVSVSFKIPERTGKWPTLSLETGNLDGRRYAQATLWANLTPTMKSTVSRFLYLRLRHLSTYDSRYLDPLWEEGAVGDATAQLTLQPKLDFGSLNLSLGGTVAHPAIGSDFDYRKLWGYFDLRLGGGTPFRFPRMIPSFGPRLRLRFFAGKLWGDVPKQAAFGVAGASGLTRFYDPTTRTPMLDEAYRIWKEGGLNLRGYASAWATTSSGWSVSLEAENLDLPLIHRVLRRLPFARAQTQAFLDLGRAKGLEGTLWDAGLGLSLTHRFPGGQWVRFRLLVPFYVSNPQIIGEEKEWNFRWLFSIRSNL